MWAFILRRLLYAVPVLLGVSMLVFVLIHLAPGDVVDILVPPEVPKEIADSLRRRFRLDEPIYMQYLAWLATSVSPSSRGGRWPRNCSVLWAIRL